MSKIIGKYFCREFDMIPNNEAVTKFTPTNYGIWVEIIDHVEGLGQEGRRWPNSPHHISNTAVAAAGIFPASTARTTNTCTPLLSITLKLIKLKLFNFYALNVILNLHVCNQQCVLCEQLFLFSKSRPLIFYTNVFRGPCVQVQPYKILHAKIMLYLI